MKKLSYKIIIALTAIVILTGVYLFLAHVYFYYKIGAANLKFCDIKSEYTISNNPGATKNLTYAALGDSLTAGAGVDQYENSYAYLLAKKLAGADKNIILKNFSYPGAKTSDLINNLLEPAISSRPDIVTVLIGVNDIHGYVSEKNFRKNYQNILERLSKETDAKIYVISIPMIGADRLVLPPYNYYFDYKTVEFNKIIKELAGEYRAEYIDLTTPTISAFQEVGPNCSRDWFHPSALGYSLFAETIYDDINK